MKQSWFVVVAVGLLASGAWADIRGPGDEVYSGTAAAWFNAQGLNVWYFDDLTLDWDTTTPPPGSSGSVLDTVTFSVGNTDAGSGSLTGANVTIAFYVNDGANGPGTATTPMLGSLTVDFPAGSFDLLPGALISRTVDNVGIDLAWDDDGDPLTPDIKPGQIWAGLIYNSITGTADPAGVGEMLVMPPQDVGGVGYTEDGYFRCPRIPGPPTGTWETLDFPYGPPANYYWELTVPEPSTLTLLALAGVALLRRR